MSSRLLAQFDRVAARLLVKFLALAPPAQRAFLAEMRREFGLSETGD